MKTLLALFILSLSSFVAHADRGGGLYFGGGLGAGSLNLSAGGEKSAFEQYGYSLIVGMELSLGGMNVNVAGEYAKFQSINSFQSSSTLEVARTSQYAARAGLIMGHFELGAGYAMYSANVRSISTPSPGYLENSYSGGIPFAYTSYTLPLQGRAEFVLEGRYGTGNLSSDSTQNLKLNDMGVVTRIVIPFR